MGQTVAAQVDEDMVWEEEEPVVRAADDIEETVDVDVAVVAEVVSGHMDCC